MTGPKIDISQVTAAIAVVDEATGSMNSVTSKILAEADATNAAITAPAGQITAAAFTDLGGGGKALSEELAMLRDDLNTLIAVAQSGSDEAASVAKSGTASAVSSAI